MKIQEHLKGKSMLFKQVIMFLILLISVILFDIFVVDNIYITLFGFSNPLYLILYLIQTIAIVLALFTRKKYLRYFYLFILFSLYTTFLSYIFISGHGFNRYEALLAIDQFSFAGEAATTYSSQLLQAGLITFSFIIFLNIIVVKSKLSLKSRYTFSPLMFLIVFFILTIKTGVVLKSFTSPFQVSFSLYYALNGNQYFGPRDIVSREVQKEAKFKKIVFLMDESVRGDILSINGYPVDTTPFLESVQKDIYNYGIASSSFNCSTASNITVQSGLLSNKIPDTQQFSLKSANIFDYMNKAGYTTIFIDGQNPSDRPIHAMTIYDIEHIDIYHQLLVSQPQLSKKNMDMYITEVIANELNKHEKVFIYVNKSGSHFSYQDNYPQEEAIFQPSLIDNEPMNDVTTVKNTYYNALRYTVDKFFKKLLHLVQKENVLIMYTSDHGQNILDDGNPRTHCSADPVVFEGNIPFMIFPLNKSKETFDNLKNRNENNFNKISHFNIFPTLIMFAGYQPNDQEKTIFDKLPTTRTFYSGDIWGRSNLKAVDFTIE